MNKLILDLVLLINVIFACSTSAASCNDKVKVDVYYESLCPDSIRFVQNELAPNYESVRNHIDINFIPCGKSDSFTNPQTGEIEFNCQHGPDECFGNKVQACVLNRLPEQDDQVNYVSCQMGVGADRGHRECVNSFGFDWNEIYGCAVGPEGTHYLLHYEKLTNQVVQSVTKWVPSIVYNHRITEDCCKNARPFKTVIASYLQNPTCRTH